VDHTDPHLLLVLFRPVDRAGRDGGRRGGQSRRHQAPRCRIRAWRQQVQRAGRQPHAYRHLHQHRVQRVAKPHSMQRVPDPARRDPPCGALAGGDSAVELVSVFELGDGTHAPAAARQQGD
jgi:hypothetical protein